MAAMWWILLGLTLAAEPVSAAASPSPADEPAAAALDSVVLIVTGRSTCSGAVIDDAGTVATAYHCVSPGGRPAVRTRGGTQATGRVRAVDRGRDLALIDVPELAGHRALPLAEAVPALGSEVSALGHPYGVSAPSGFLEGTLRWSMTRGVVSAIGPHAVQFSAPINPGNSGGPVVDEHGRLVAVVSRRTGGSEGLGFGGRVEHLRALLDAPESGVGAVGGTWGVQPMITAWNGTSGDLSAGGRLEVAFRDRVVLSGILRAGLSPRWSALNYGDVTFAGPGVRGGLRQRVGRGRFAPLIDAWGEGTVLLGYTGSVQGNEVDLPRPTQAWTVLIGGGLMVGGAGLEAGCSPVGDGCAASFVLNWPGTVGVF